MILNFLILLAVAAVFFVLIRIPTPKQKARDEARRAAAAARKRP